MNYSIGDVSLYQVMIYMLFGLLTAIVTYVITHYLVPMLSRHKHARMQFWQKAQIIFWLVYVGVLFVILFGMNMYVTVAMTVVIFGAGWNYWRNVFSGLVIKLNSQPKIGEAIDVEFAKGVIKAIGMSQSELINESGETVVIPNDILRTSVFKHLNKETNVQVHSFIITTSTGRTIEAIYSMTLECPFVSANQKVEVDRMGPNEVVVRASVIDNSFIDKVNTYLHQMCGPEGNA